MPPATPSSPRISRETPAVPAPEIPAIPVLHALEAKKRRLRAASASRRLRAGRRPLKAGLTADSEHGWPEQRRKLGDLRRQFLRIPNEFPPTNITWEQLTPVPPPLKDSERPETLGGLPIRPKRPRTKKKKIVQKTLVKDMASTADLCKLITDSVTIQASFGRRIPFIPFDH